MEEFYVNLIRRGSEDRLFIVNHRSPKGAAARVLWGLIHRKQSKMSLKESRARLSKIYFSEVEQYKSMDYSIFEVKHRRKSSLSESYKVCYYIYKGII